MSLSEMKRWVKHKAQEFLEDSGIEQGMNGMFPSGAFSINVLASQASPSLLEQDVFVTEYEYTTITICPIGSSHSRPFNMTQPPDTIPTYSQPQSATQRPSIIPTSLPLASQPSNDTLFDGVDYIVAGVGSFKNKKEFVFNTSTLPDGLRASNYTVHDTENGMPFNHKFDPANVYCDGDFVNLRVSATPDPSPGDTVSCAEIVTTENSIKYASVRTKVIFSDVPGTCHGMFFYLDDTQECDIEYLTDPTSLSNNNGSQIPLWLSNQALEAGQQATQSTSAAPYDVTEVHEYRIDWVEEYTAFYLDGRLMNKYTTNVPNKAGSWIWNNWSNGDQGWSVGPPAQDNIMRIQSITMYYNTDDNSEGE